jgi:cytochrome c biogenesis protein
MKTSTGGFNPRSKYKILNRFIELLSSMRFAISVLVWVSLVSMIGTFVKQAETTTFYVERYGVLWFETFRLLNITHIYSSYLFLCALLLLLISVSLCLYRYTPRIWRDYKRFSFYTQIYQLKKLPQHQEGFSNLSPSEISQKVLLKLKQSHFRIATQERSESSQYLITAKKGDFKRLGYIFAHGAILLIVIGSMMDGNLMTKFSIWWNNLSPIPAEQASQIQLTEKNYLPSQQLSFRANLWVAEQEKSRLGIVNTPEGLLFQPLPFSIELQKFDVDYYSTGMPKSFVSHVVIHDQTTNTTSPQTIEVNKPLTYQGFTIYQSSFEDGGSILNLRRYNLNATTDPLEKALLGQTLETKVGSTFFIAADHRNDTRNREISLTGFRPINVEDSATLLQTEQSASTAENTSIAQQINRLAQPHQQTQKQFTNIGPSFEFQETKASGLVSFKTYAYPVNLDGADQFLFGIKRPTDNDYQFLKIPADPDGKIDDFLRLSFILKQPKALLKAKQQYLSQHKQLSQEQQLGLSHAIDQIQQTFHQPSSAGALVDLSNFVEQRIKDPNNPLSKERETKFVNFLLGLTKQQLLALLNIAREQTNLPARENNEETQLFMERSMLALSDLTQYPNTDLLTLEDYQEIKASVFQISKAPGTLIVYIGCLLLLLGIFAMLYIREEKIWFYVSADQNPENAQQSHWVIASQNKQDRRLKNKNLLNLTQNL